MISIIFKLLAIILVYVQDSQGLSVGSLGPSEYDSQFWEGPLPPPYPPIKTEDVKFQLFTRDHKNGEFLDLNDDSTFLNSAFNSSYPVKIATHGWKDDGSAPYLQAFKYYLLQNGKYNFIEVDWGPCSYRHYLASCDCMHDVGEITAQFIKKLSLLNKVPLTDIHIIGHSLGGQLVGIISKYIGKRTLGRITSLDPASPQFESTISDNRLDPLDARIVDVIVTGLDNLGMKKVIGTMNFYPNADMQFQPGCESIDTIDDDCSHHASVLYFINTVLKDNRQKYIATKCESVENLRSGKCNGEKVVMGLDLHQTSPGIYYIKIPDRPLLGY